MFCLVNHIYRGGLGNKDPKNPKKVVGYLILRHTLVSVPYRSDSLSSLAVSSDILAEASRSVANKKTRISIRHVGIYVQFKAQ